GDDDRHLGRPGMVEGLDRLGHHAVVGGDHQHGDVGGLGAAGAHGGERLVAGRVDERDQAPVLVDLVGADVLGDATGLPSDHIGLPDAVEEQRLAVVDVAHHGDDRRAGSQVLFVLVVVGEHGLELDLLLLAGIDEQHLGADVVGEQLDHVVRERLGGGDHLALLQQEEDDVGRRAVQLGPEVLGGRAALDDDLTLGDRRVRMRVAGGLGGLDLLQATPATPPSRAPRPTGAAAAAGTTARTTGTACEPTGTTAGTAGTAGEAAGATGRTTGAASRPADETTGAWPAAATTGSAGTT